MTDRAIQYVHQSLASAGFVVLDPEIACSLRPDLWFGRGVEASGELAEWRTKSGLASVGRVARYRVQFADRQAPALVLARSGDELAHRLAWITGMVVLSCEIDLAPPFLALPTVAPDPLAAELAKRAAAERARVEALAAQEPPSHDCALRRENLAARAELARVH